MSDTTNPGASYETADEYFESDQFKLEVIALARSGAEAISKELGCHDEETVNKFAELLYEWAEKNHRTMMRGFVFGSGSLAEDDPARKGGRNDA